MFKMNPVFISRKGLLLTTVLALSACAAPVEVQAPPEAPQIGGPDNLNIGERPPEFSEIGFEIVERIDPEKAAITRLRQIALTEAAQGYGARMGFARRSWDISRILERRSPELSRIFAFERIATGAPRRVGYIIPPVVSRSFEAFESVDGGRSASAADEYLTVVAPGRISPVIPTWRDWLLFSPQTPEAPAHSLNPTTSEELAFFEEKFRDGWEAGVAQADDELRNRFDRLIRDYEGMLQYRRLVSLGMMNRMVIADADFGVTDTGGDMRIGDRTIEIVSDAEFNANPDIWRPAAVDARDREMVQSGSVAPDARRSERANQESREILRALSSVPSLPEESP